MKSSKVKRIESVKPYNGQNGTVYYHCLEMDNGDKINIGKKKEIQVGWELNYEIVEVGQQEYQKSKSVSPSFKKPFDSKGIEVGHALNNAVNLICAGVELESVDAFKNHEEKIYKYAKVIMAIAKKLKDE